MEEQDGLKRILIIRLSAMGDVLLTTPLVRSVKARYPEARIDFLVKEDYAPLLRTNRHLDNLLLFSPESGFFEIRRILQKIRETEYDAILDLQVNLRSLIFRAFSGARRRIHHRPDRWRRFLLVHFGRGLQSVFQPVPLRFFDSISSLNVEDDGGGLDLIVEEGAKQTAVSVLGEGRRIALAPGASRFTKRWPAEGFAEVGAHFQEKGNKVVLLGGEDDRDVCEEVARRMQKAPLNVAGRFLLQETAAAIAGSDLLISNDTGLMHMGAALRKPVVAVFGPTTAHLGFAPFRTSSVVVERPLSCRPCSYHGTERCPKGHFKCMEEIQSMDVIRAAESLLQRE